MSKISIGKNLYLKGRVGWKGLKKSEYLNSGEYRIINALALEENKINWNKAGYISKERYEESPEIMLQKNDILISKDGTLGKIGYVDELDTKTTIASGIFLLRNTSPEAIDTRYLYQLLKSNIFKDFIKNNKAEGSTINHLYQADLVNFEVDFPCLSLQNSISRILDSIDNKISINNKINDNLEKQLDTYYKYYFVQNNDSKITKSLLELADLYQPETIPTKQLDDKLPYFVYGSNGIIGKYDKFNHEDHEIAVACRGSCGNTLITLPKSWITGNAMVVKPKSNFLYKEFLFQTLKFKSPAYLISGSVQSQLTRENLSLYHVQIPCIKKLDKFENIASSIRKKVISNLLETNELIRLRDFLLPLLMNGQAKID